MLVLELGHKERIERLLFSPDGRSLVAPCSSGVYIWRTVADGQRAERFSDSAYAGSLRFSPDGQFLFAGYREMFRIDLATGAPTHVPLLSRYSSQFDVSKAAPFLILANYEMATAGPSTRITVWRLGEVFSQNGKVWENVLSGFSGYSPQFLPEGNRFIRIEGGWSNARRGLEYQILTCDLADGNVLEKSDLIPFSFQGVHLSPDGTRVAMHETNRLDLVWISPGRGKPVRIRNTNRKHYTGVAFHPSGSSVAATSNDQTVKFYDPATGDEIRTFTWKLKRMRSIAFSPDGALAAAGSEEGKVMVWDVDS